MNKTIALLIQAVHQIIRNLYGTIVHPYLTWQHLKREPHLISSTLTLLLISLIFTFRAPLTYGLTDLPSWPRSFLAAYIIAISSYLITTSLIWLTTSKISSSKISYQVIYTTWIYSYLPTGLWFFITQLTYYLIPKTAPILFSFIQEPIHNTAHYYLIIIYTLLFTTLSIYFLIWKLLLFYLTLRITCNLNPKQIIQTTLILTPITAAYTITLYLFGLWRIPFL